MQKNGFILKEILESYGKAKSRPTGGPGRSWFIYSVKSFMFSLEACMTLLLVKNYKSEHLYFKKSPVALRGARLAFVRLVAAGPRLRLVTERIPIHLQTLSD